MPNKFVWFLTLAVFSGLSMNLILQFGIGLQWIALGGDSGNNGKTEKGVFLVRLGIYFTSIMILWLFFSFLQSVFFLGFFEYILVFPVSSLFFTLIEYLAGRLVLRTDWRGEPVSYSRFIGSLITGDGQSSLNGAPVGAALFIILGLSGGFAQAAALSFGFSTGAALAVLIAFEIRRRSAAEAVPRSLRGGPLALITLGLLSLVFTSAAIVFYNVLGVN
jgi:hypothetical protein